MFLLIYFSCRETNFIKMASFDIVFKAVYNLIYQILTNLLFLCMYHILCVWSRIILKYNPMFDLKNFQLCQTKIGIIAMHIIIFHVSSQFEHNISIVRWTLLIRVMKPEMIMESIKDPIDLNCSNIHAVIELCMCTACS